MSRFRYTAQADTDLNEITDYYSAHNPDAGLRLIDAIEAACQHAANQPRSGRPRDDLGPGIRSYVTKGYVIFFRATPEGVDVLRVIHGSRDIGPEMFEE